MNKGWPTRWHLLYYILLNMFQTLIRPSSGVSEYLLCCVGWLEACWCYVAGLSVGDVVSECKLNHHLYSNIKMMHGPIRISYFHMQSWWRGLQVKVKELSQVTCYLCSLQENATSPISCSTGSYGYRHTLRICNTYCFFYNNNGYANASQCYATRSLPNSFLCTYHAFLLFIVYY